MGLSRDEQIQREVYAVAAMNALLPSVIDVNGGWMSGGEPSPTMSQIAKLSVEAADALMAALKEPHD